MSETFHPFNKLPPEIRHKIWEAAVRPVDIPGIHFFSLIFQDAPTLPEEHLIPNNTVPIPALSREKPAFLASPRGQDGWRETSWHHQDDSSQFIDAGLWTACQESRAIIHREYRKRSTKVWATESTISRHKQMQCVLPEVDLICLTGISGFQSRMASPKQPRALDNSWVNWSRLDIGFDMQCTDTGSDRLSKMEIPTYDHLERLITAFVASFQSWPPFSFWIIDRKIKKAKQSKTGRVFEGERGLRLIEIHRPTQATGRGQIKTLAVSGGRALSWARQFNNIYWNTSSRVIREAYGITEISPAIGVLAIEGQE